MKTMTYYIARVLTRVAPPPPVDPSMTDEAIEARQNRLRQRQKTMFDQMMKDGTHLFKKGKWTIGDSHILREAGLVK